jgi:hypothetical protein
MIQSAGMSTGRLLSRHAALLPGVVLELIRIGWSHRRSSWWARVPFVPVPSGTHLGWRRETAYGRPDISARLGDIVEYAAWRRRQRRACS